MTDFIKLSSTLCIWICLENNNSNIIYLSFCAFLLGRESINLEGFKYHFYQVSICTSTIFFYLFNKPNFLTIIYQRLWLVWCIWQLITINYSFRQLSCDVISVIRGPPLFRFPPNGISSQEVSCAMSWRCCIFALRRISSFIECTM